jgi:predicted RNA-binding protein with PIN domain
MALLIDGYNLLHVTGLVGRAGSGLQGSRNALLRFLASAIEPKELAETTVVFDATEAPPGLPRIVTHDGMTVRYASEYPDADALLEELIAAHHVPRSLTVVSSDHRVQRAARRRRAPFVDSDVWFAEIARRRTQRQGASSTPVRREVHLSAEEIAYWIAEFEAEANPRSSAARDAQPSPLDDPFPPGYAEELFDNDESDDD